MSIRLAYAAVALLAAGLSGQVLAPGPAASQDDPGFRPDALPLAALVGTWSNASIHMHAGQPDQPLWQVLRIGSDGQAVHDYFIADPRHSDLPPASRLFSDWEAGTYIDPQPDKGAVAVIRFAPTESWTYDPAEEGYRILRGGMLPTFRSFALSVDETVLRLSAPTVVQIEGLLTPRTFPDDLQGTDFSRQVQPLPSAVEAIGWGRLKAR